MTKKYLPDINKLNDKSLLGILIHLKCSQVQVAPEKKKGTRNKGQISHYQSPEKHVLPQHPVTGTEHHKYSQLSV